MTENLKQLIKEVLVELPKESQEVINSFGWENISEEIGKKYYFGAQEINKLQVEIALVMAGIEKQNSLALNIENEIVTSKDDAIKIAEEIVQKIFKPMVNKLTEMIKKNLKSRVIHWQQNLNFILSGGDYTTFIERVKNETKDEILKGYQNLGPSKMDDLKSKFTI